MRAGTGPGRPGKGDRKLVAARHPRDQADAIEQLAHARGITLTDVMVAITRVGLAHLDEAKLPPPREVLPETA